MEQALGLLFDVVNFTVIEAGLTHYAFVVIFARDLVDEVDLSYVLGTGVWRREMIQILESVLVCLMRCKVWPFLLQIKIDEACRARLDHRLVIRAHRAEKQWIEPILVSV